MYADRLEAEARSVKTRLTGSTLEPLSSVRGKVSFKRAGVPGTRGRLRSGADDEKWQHDLFQDVETFLKPQGTGAGAGDLRSLLASRQQAKLGSSGRLAGRMGAPGSASAARAAVDLRGQLGGARRRGAVTGVRPAAPARRKAPGAGAGQSAAALAQKRLTVTLRNEGGEEYVEDEGEEDVGPAAVPAVIRGGRGSLLVTTQTEEEEDVDMEGDVMPGQVPLQPKRLPRGGGGGGGGARSSQQSVATLLSSLGLAKYTSTLEAEEIDIPALQQMTEDDLKELGIPMGPRKKIIQAAGGA